MKWRAYGTYKPVDAWQERIPEHWRQVALRLVATSRCDGPFGSGLKSDTYTQSGARVVRLQNIRPGEFDDRDAAYIDLQYFQAELQRHEVVEGDVLIAGLGDENNLVGRACVAPRGISPALVKADCFRFRLDPHFAVPEFVALQLTAGARPDSARLGAGSTRQRIPLSAMASRPLALPPLAEQLEIVRFLRRQTAKLDTLIAKQGRLIELLGEKRQAVTSHAVTKGLDAKAPTKDSGVEPIGSVPAHWSVRRLRFLANVQTGIAKGKDYTDVPTVIVPYLRVANVQDGFLDLEDIATLSVPIQEVRRYLLRPGDVLMNEGGDFDKLGRGHVWSGEIDPCVHQNHVFAVRPYGVSPEWLTTVTGSAYAQYYFMSRSKQSTNLASISSTNIMELPVVLPPIDEQRHILAAVRAKTAAVDALTATARRSIELMHEHRAALISAAVTGKIDVRGAMAVAPVDLDALTPA